MSTPLETSIFCRAAVELPATATGEMMFMPGGIQVITPVEGGIDKPITVQVDAAGAQQIEAQRAALSAKGKRPFFDFNHEDRAASFWPAAFFWRDGHEPGIYCRGEWSATGKASVEGKEWRQFSPVFHVDNKRGNPARIVCRPAANPNMGGLVNDAAFHRISPLWAKDSAGAAGENQNHNPENTIMNPTELAALQARITSLESDITALKGKNSADAAGELRAKQAELQAAQSQIEADAAKKENESLKAKNKAQGDAISARNKVDAQAAVDDAVKRGAIPAQDKATQDQLVCKGTEDPSFLTSIKALQGNPALQGRITPANPTQRIEMGAISGKDAVAAYAAVVCRNAEIKDRHHPDKRKLANEAAAIFAAEMKGKEDQWMTVSLAEAIKAADVTSASIGTLAGTLVLQRNLPLLAYQYPQLRTMFSDFSDAPGLWQQTEITRIPISPAVTEYDGTLDTNGRPKGFVVVTPAQSVDVGITLNKHVGIPMIFGVQTLASTARNLFAEQGAGAINALGGYFVDMATALMTAANFNAYKQITDASCGTTSGSTAITLATTAGVYPGQDISGTGIPTGAHIASVTDGTNAVMTLAATATATVTATLNAAKVPTLYPTYVKALADFNMASLSEIGAAFDIIKVPMMNRSIMLNAAYYNRLANDPTFNTFFAATRSPDVINKGMLPELMGFGPQKAPFFPTSSNRTGFAYHQAAIALKSRLPQDFTQAVSAMVPGTVTTVTDPDTGLSVQLVERVDLTGSYAESRIEVMLGVAVGDRRAGMVLTSA